MSSYQDLLKNWVELYTSELYSWAFHKTSNQEIAKDLVQDTFLVVSEKIAHFEGRSSPKTWLFSILNHKIIDYYRKKVKQPVAAENDILRSVFNENEGWNSERIPKDWDDEEHLLDNREFLKILSFCLEQLPEKWNSAVKLKYLMQKKGEEICQELEIAPTNFWQIIHRAKVQLRNCIENKWFDK